MEGATVEITGGFVSGEDVLAFTNANGITGSWNATTRRPVTDEAQRRLPELQKQRWSQLHMTTRMTITPIQAIVQSPWTVYDGDNYSTAATSTIAITGANDAPGAARCGCNTCIYRR